MKIGSSHVWNPSMEGDTLRYWLQHNSNLFLSGDQVVHWSSAVTGSTERWSQSTETNRPIVVTEGTGALGGVDFDGNDNYLTGTQLTLTGTYVLGVRFKLEDNVAGNDVLVGDLSASNNFVRLNNPSQIGIKHSSGQKIFDMNSGAIFDQDSSFSLVIGRSGDDVISIWVDGVVQSDTETAAGNFLVDGLGARSGITNYFSGVIFEICIFKDTYSTRLAENLSGHLMSLKID